MFGREHITPWLSVLAPAVSASVGRFVPQLAAYRTYWVAYVKVSVTVRALGIWPVYPLVAFLHPVPRPSVEHYATLYDYIREHLMVIPFARDGWMHRY